MKPLHLLTLLASSAATVLAAPNTAATPPSSAAVPAADSVIGRIGPIQVNAADVRASISALTSQEGAAIKNDPALLNQVVRSLLVQKVLLSEAESKGHDKKPEVAAQLARAREVALTESYLQTVSTPPDSYPGEADLKAAYEIAKPAIGVPKSWRLAQIFISVGKDADKAAADKAQSKLDTVQKALKGAGADFSKLAASHSEEQNSAGRGGEIGWLAESQIQPGIREKLGVLKVNAVSEPVRLEDGWHIVKVLDAREPYTPTLDQIRSQLVAQLRAEKTRANSQAYLAKLLQENPLAVNELALSQLVGEAKK
ncbi:MAG: peptidylprolyl isomerase [Verrucomicrobiota bacterium]